MIKPYTIFFLIVVLTTGACQSPSKPPVEVAAKPEKVEKYQKASLELGVAVDAQTYPHSGDLLASAQWLDQLGQNVVVVASQPGEKGTPARIEARHYVKNQSENTLLWEMKDQTEPCACNCRVQLGEEQLQVNDIDLNGTAEVYFLYLLDHQCQDNKQPIPTRLLLHEGPLKLELKGYTNITNSTEPGVHSINRLGDLEQLNPAVKRKALEYWNDFIVEEKKAALKQYRQPSDNE